MNNTSGKCLFCISLGIRISGPEDGLDSDIFLCEKCKKLLRNKSTALPLIRGNLTLSMRGKGDPKKNKKMIDEFIEKIAEWKPRN